MRRSTHWFLAALTTGTLAIAGCGGGDKQDENEPEGNFKTEVVSATFPENQQLAKSSEINIVVRNTDNKEIPNIAVTLNGLSKRKDNKALADPNRPQFVLNGEPKTIGTFPEQKEAGPEGGETAYVNTWALGPLKPGEEKKFTWKVTAVEAGPYRLSYAVSAGLDGKAKAVDSSGGQPKGVFTGTVSNDPPQTKVADDGVTVIETESGRKIITKDGKAVIQTEDGPVAVEKEP